MKFGWSFCDITLKNLTLDNGRQKNLSENFRKNAVLMQQQEGPTI